MNQSISPSSQFPSRKGNISTGYSNPPHNRALSRPHSLSRRHISLLDPLSLHRMTGYQTKGLTTTTNSPVRVAHASVWSPHQHDQSSFEYDSHDSLSHAYRRTLPFGRTGRHSHITLHALVLGLVLQARNDTLTPTRNLLRNTRGEVWVVLRLSIGPQLSLRDQLRGQVLQWCIDTTAFFFFFVDLPYLPFPLSLSLSFSLSIFLFLFNFSFIFF